MAAAADGDPVPIEDNGMSPEEQKKEELQNDPTFGKYLVMLKIKQKLINIRTKMR
jgi:hypothetical protein